MQKLTAGSTDYFDEFHQDMVEGDEDRGYTLLQQGVTDPEVKIGDVLLVQFDEQRGWYVTDGWPHFSTVCAPDGTRLEGWLSGAELVHWLRGEQIPDQLLSDHEPAHFLADVEAVSDNLFLLNTGVLTWRVERVQYDPADLTSFDEFNPDNLPDGWHVGWAVYRTSSSGWSLADALYDSDAGGAPNVAFWLSPIIAMTAYKHVVAPAEVR